MRYDSKTAIRFSTCILYQLIEDVPEENTTCKLDCRKVQCTEREWITCRRRLLRSGGESMPDREFCRSLA
jgi:hypothetical protein